MKERTLQILAPFRSLFLPLMGCMALFSMLDLKAQNLYAANRTSVEQQAKEPKKH